MNMLTPQEIKDKTFKKVTVWGYDMNAVDSFKETVFDDYTKLYKENITLKSKLKVLITRLEEYKSVEESMRKTLVAAEQTAAQKLEECEAQIAERERLAGERIDLKLKDFKSLIASEEARLSAAAAESKSFIDHVITLYKSEIDKLNTLASDDKIVSAVQSSSYNAPASNPASSGFVVHTPSVLPNTTPIPDLPIDTDDLLRDSEMRVMEIDMGDEPRAASKSSTKYKTDDGFEDDEETINLSPKPKFEFENLKFGNKYNPKN